MNLANLKMLIAQIEAKDHDFAVDIANAENASRRTPPVHLASSNAVVPLLMARRSYRFEALTLLKLLIDTHIVRVPNECTQQGETHELRSVEAAR